MLSTAKVKFVHMSPRKIRYVLDLVRKKSVPAAYSILDRANKRASGLVRKLIQQAADSALKQHKTAAESLYVSKIFADGAGMMKRFRAMSMGRAGSIFKRLSHVTVELDALRRAPAAAPQAPKAPAETKAKAPRLQAGKASSGARKEAPAKHKKMAGAK